MNRRITPLISALLLATLAGGAQAHQVWIEASGNQARLHFGEYADNLRETSPGLLDKFDGVPVLEQRAGGQTQRVQGQRTAKYVDEKDPHRCGVLRNETVANSRSPRFQASDCF